MTGKREPMPAEGTLVPANVRALGIVSLLMAASSQMTHSLLPIFLVTVMGASMATVGLIEGLAEATNSFLRAFAGTISDRAGRRKPLVVLGYGLSACIKPVFPLAGDVPTIVLARMLDRTGKGLRDAPRDALIADHVPARMRGSGYGLRISLFTIGSCLGPLLATGIMAASGNNFRLVFWIAVLPAVLSVLVLMARVEEAPISGYQGTRRFQPAWLMRLPTLFWWVVGIAFLIALARFSQAFLLLRAKEVGISTTTVPVFLSVMGLVYGMTAYPFGMLADRVDRRLQLGAGIAVLAACHLTLANAMTAEALLAGAILWGLQLGIIDGLLAANVADVAPDDLRGTAFGVYYCVLGVASLIASSAAGWLWGIGGGRLAFTAGSLLALLAIIALCVAHSRLPSRSAMVSNRSHTTE